MDTVTRDAIAWRNPAEPGSHEPCEILECFEEDGCTWFVVLFCDGERMVIPSDELELDCAELRGGDLRKLSPRRPGLPLAA